MWPSRPRARNHLQEEQTTPGELSRVLTPFIEALQELDLICQGVHLGLELDLVHVGGIHVLGNTERGLPLPALLCQGAPGSLLSPFRHASLGGWSLRANQPLCRATAAPGSKGTASEAAHCLYKGLKMSGTLESKPSLLETKWPIGPFLIPTNISYQVPRAPRAFAALLTHLYLLSITNSFSAAVRLLISTSYRVCGAKRKERHQWDSSLLQNAHWAVAIASVPKAARQVTHNLRFFMLLRARRAFSRGMESSGEV